VTHDHDAWNQIDATTLQALCDAGESESTTLDFKRLAPKLQRDDPDHEFAKDVCAFAKANGGDLVHGVADARVWPKCLMPILGKPFDATAWSRRCCTRSGSASVKCAAIATTRPGDGVR